MSGLIKTGLGFFTGGSSVWLPWAIAGGAVAILGGALWVQTDRLGAAKVELQATVRSLKEAREDTGRWKLASDQQGKVITEQAAQLERHRADEAKAAQVAQQVEADRQAQLAKLKSDIDSLKEKARANPDQVRPLGPIVLDALRVR